MKRMFGIAMLLGLFACGGGEGSTVEVEEGLYSNGGSTGGSGATTICYSISCPGTQLDDCWKPCTAAPGGTISGCTTACGCTKTPCKTTSGTVAQ